MSGSACVACTVIGSGLLDCSSHTDAELVIVEGKSAANALRAVRNRSCQAIFATQGKIVSPHKNSPRKLLDNPIIASLLRSINTTGLSTFDDVELRFQRIVLLTDGDADGVHARTLLTSLFCLHMPWIVTGEFLFQVYPPLYGLHSSALSEPRYALTQNHRDRLIKQLQAEGVSGVESTYYKGIASLPGAVLASRCVNPGSRVIRQVNSADCTAVRATWR